MAVSCLGGGLAVLVLLAAGNALRGQVEAVSFAGTPMELSSQDLAVTPAAAEGPSSGQGPSITRSKLLLPKVAQTKSALLPSVA